MKDFKNIRQIFLFDRYFSRSPVSRVSWAFECCISSVKKICFVILRLYNNQKNLNFLIITGPKGVKSVFGRWLLSAPKGRSTSRREACYEPRCEATWFVTGGASRRPPMTVAKRHHGPSGRWLSQSDITTLRVDDRSEACRFATGGASHRPTSRPKADDCFAARRAAKHHDASRRWLSRSDITTEGRWLLSTPSGCSTSSTLCVVMLRSNNHGAKHVTNHVAKQRGS
jgi:hypothetical protein